jgi:hypothetical protein
MIFRHDIQRLAKAALSEITKDKRHVYYVLKDPSIFNNFVDILHDRLNQIELIGMKKNKHFDMLEISKAVYKFTYALVKQTHDNMSK